MLECREKKWIKSLLSWRPSGQVFKAWNFGSKGPGIRTPRRTICVLFLLNKKIYSNCLTWLKWKWVPGFYLCVAVASPCSKINVAPLANRQINVWLYWYLCSTHQGSNCEVPIVRAWLCYKALFKCPFAYFIYLMLRWWYFWILFRIKRQLFVCCIPYDYRGIQHAVGGCYW